MHSKLMKKLEKEAALFALLVKTSPQEKCIISELDIVPEKGDLFLLAQPQSLSKQQLHSGATFIYVIDQIPKWHYFLHHSLVENLCHKNVSFFFPTHEKEIDDLIEKCRFRRVKTVGRNASCQLLERRLMHRMALDRELKDYGKSGFINYKNLLTSSREVTYGQQLKGQLKGDSAIIVGNHPNLSKYAGCLRQIAKDHHIFAVGRAPFFLEEMNIPFDYVVECDPNPRLEGRKKLKKRYPIFCSYRMHSSWLDLLEGPMVIMGKSMLGFYETFLFRKLGWEEISFDGGYNAANFAFMTAIMLGCHQITLLGIESNTEVIDLILGEEWMVHTRKQFLDVAAFHYTDHQPWTGFEKAPIHFSGQKKCSLSYWLHVIPETLQQEILEEIFTMMKDNALLLEKMHGAFVPTDPVLYEWVSIVYEFLRKKSPRTSPYKLYKRFFTAFLGQEGVFL